MPGLGTQTGSCPPSRTRTPATRSGTATTSRTRRRSPEQEEEAPPWRRSTRTADRAGASGQELALLESNAGARSQAILGYYAKMEGSFNATVDTEAAARSKRSRLAASAAAAAVMAAEDSAAAASSSAAVGQQQAGHHQRRL